METILNNRPLAYYYSDNTEQGLTPNHLLFGWTIKLFDPEPIDITHDINFQSKKTSNIMKSFLGTMAERIFKYATWESQNYINKQKSPYDKFKRRCINREKTKIHMEDGYRIRGR